MSVLDQLRPLLEDPTAHGETTLQTGLGYSSSAPVLVRVRRRGHRFDLADDGTAVELAGRPEGWRDVVERLVATHGLNVNRRGTVFVPAVAGRDLVALAGQVAEVSRAAYLELLELDD